MVRKESILSVNSKIAIAKDVIKDGLNSFRRPTIVWSGGKDSTVVLDLVSKCAEELGIKLPTVLFIDHGDHYPETFEIISKSEGKYNFKTIIAKNSDALNTIKNGKIQVSDLSEHNRNEVNRIGFLNKEFDYSLESDVGNHILKTVPMNDAIVEYRFDALFTGVRWDENDARSTEIFMSPRNNPEHIRIQPILPFLEKDIWQYIFKHNLLIHPKYYEGYRSIDGIHDSKKVSDLPAWEQDFDVISERSGRSQDKEGMMEKLRKFGYM